MEGESLSAEDLTCPICKERLKDPFVTSCGHSFCYSCIIIHLQNKKVCPCCSEYLTSDKVFPNYLLSKVVAQAKKETNRKEGTLLEQLQAAISSDKQFLRLPELDVLLETLEEKKHDLQQKEKENNLELLLHFLTHSKLSKTQKLLELQEELHILDRDIHHVETRQYALPAAAGRLLALPNITNPAWLQRHAQHRQSQVVVGEGSGEGPGKLVIVKETDSKLPNGQASHSLAQPEESTSQGANKQEQGERPGLKLSAPQSRSIYYPHPSSSQRRSKTSAPGPEEAAPASHLSAQPSTSSPQLVNQSSGTSPPSVSLQHTSGQRNEQAAIQPSSDQQRPRPYPSQAQMQSPSREAAQPAATSEISSGMLSGTTTASMTTKASSETGNRPQNAVRKRHFESQFEDLQQHYLRMRQRQMEEFKRRRLSEDLEDQTVARSSNGAVNRSTSLEADTLDAAADMRLPIQNRDTAATAGQNGADVGPAEPACLQEFSRMLSMSRRSRLEVVASMPGAGHNTSAAILSSVAFDKDAQYFATAGVSKRISIYSFDKAVEGFGPHHSSQPLVQLRSRSKLSCVSYNCFNSNQLMSSDYEGVITLWDTQIAHPITEYEAHDKRVWSVDFCPSHHQLLASGSDDGRVKVWSMNQPSCVAELNVRANVCSVRYCPNSLHELAVGSADHNIMLFDTRRFTKPVALLSGHRKAVSYVAYMNDKELVSASTDNSLRLWNAAERKPLRKFSGHLNEKNFVGLSCEGDFVACGSETSEIFIFYRSMSKPITRTLFAPVLASNEGVPRTNAPFVSALCWKPKCDRRTLLAANSQGAVKILQLVC